MFCAAPVTRSTKIIFNPKPRTNLSGAFLFCVPAGTKLVTADTVDCAKNFQHKADRLKEALKNTGFATFSPLASLKLKVNCWNRNDLTNKHERKIMKLMTYHRPGLAWPSFGRLANLQDELDRLFETPLQAWAPALDVHEDKDKFTVNLEVPGLKREDINVHLEDGSLVI